jgi:hypothetical protein
MKPESKWDGTMEVQMVKELLVEDLIAQTREAIASFGYSKSTLWQYDYAWAELCCYFSIHDTSSFSIELADRYVGEAREKYEQGELKEWKFKRICKTTDLLIQCHENGCVHRMHLPEWWNQGLREQYSIDIFDNYILVLRRADYGGETIGLYGLVAKEFLKYLEDQHIENLEQLTTRDVGSFISVISGSYQPTSMRTILSGLRSFTRFAAQTGLTSSDLTVAIPKSFGRKTALIAVITAKPKFRFINRASTKLPAHLR